MDNRDDDEDKRKRERRKQDRNFLSPEATFIDKSPSLQALHAQSSTETSGLGETVTSGFSSQESVHSNRSNKSRGANRAKAIHRPFPDHLNKSEDSGVQIRIDDLDDKAGDRIQDERKQNRTATSDLTENIESDSAQNENEFDELFARSAGAGENHIGLSVDNIDHEWESRSSHRGSIKSKSSHTSVFRTKSGGARKFLGSGTNSRWVKWSQDRKESYRRKLESIEQSKETVDRTPTPIKKARQECLKFVHPDLEHTYLTQNDIDDLRIHREQMHQTYNVIEKNRRHNPAARTRVQFTVTQWNLLTDFWEHFLFARARYVGLALCAVSMVLLVISVSHNTWITVTVGAGANAKTLHEGLWKNCSLLYNEDICRSTNGREWQNAVIGLLIFSASFGFLAAVLAICGVCATPLPKKIYYFHSSGEIFLVCAISTTVALIIYPVAIEFDSTITTHRYGIGYGMGWGGAFFFFAAAICMSLDELVRESTTLKCCKWCFKSKHSDRTELQQV